MVRYYAQGCYVMDSSHQDIARGVDWETAQFIVRACNAHEGLVKALKGLIELYNTDEGCRSLPEYINATAALAAA